MARLESFFRAGLIVRVGIGVGIAAALTGGCGEPPDQDTIPDVEQPLFPQGSTLWEPASGDQVTALNICWENPTAAGGSPQTRNWAQTAVQDTWGQANLIFRFSTSCKGNEQFRITLEDIANPGPHTEGLGRNVGKVHLNHLFTKWPTAAQKRNGALNCSLPANLQFCIQTIAAHEFGHALGLAHDQNRADTSCPNGPEQGSSGDLPMGRPDPDSIMSYCPGGEWSGPTLSTLDLQHIRRLYGGRGAFVADGGTYAVRTQPGAYYRLGLPRGLSGPPTLLTSSAHLQESDGTRNMMVVRKQSGTGNIKYSDAVSLQDQRTSLYYCPTTLTSIQTPPCGICPPVITTIPVTAGSPTPCLWTVTSPPSHSFSSALAVQVNYPFVLMSGTQSFSGTSDLRFLGDFFPD